jgi:subtilisin family serine protease
MPPPKRSGARRRSSSSRGGRAGAKGALPDLIYAQASPRSIGGTSLFDAGAAVNSGTVQAFFSEAAVVQAAVNRLLESGFQVLQVAPTTINIAGTPAAFQRAFGSELVTEERPVIRGGQVEDTATFIDDARTPISGLVDTRESAMSDVLEGVAIEEPVQYFQNAFAPPKAYWHLDVPGDVSLGVNADQAHRAGITGRGVSVCMVDTGWFRHPYFTQRGYRSAPVVLAPGASAPNDDTVGHGTGESANAFAAAPDIEFTMVKQSPTNATASFNAAVGLRPQIISCSWGFDLQTGPLSAAMQALAAAVATAVASGIIVVFSAGNGHFGFPGQHPDVISAGGVFMEANGSTTASNYASGFASSVYPGRNVPDVSGLVGMLPKAIYIMLPLQAGDDIDVGNAGGTHPNGDETANNDGWAAFSGTSAAAPQIAGVCALIKQACPRLTPAEVKDILQRTARDVTTGTCNPRMGNAAGPGPDLATGHGLVDANRAVLMAKVRCLGPIRPIRPIQPIEPIQPITPITPIQPITPVQPVMPIQPISPITPIQPISPITPIQPISPIGPGPVAGQAEPPSALSADDVSALEDLIMEGEGDLDL